MKLAFLLLLSSPAFAYVRTTNTDDLCIWWFSRGHGFRIDAQKTPDVAGAAGFDAIGAHRRILPGQQNVNLILFRTRSCAQVVPSWTSRSPRSGASIL